MSLSPSLRPRRSVLYMPGSNERAMEKARALAVDSVVFDLEDAVAPDQKRKARKLILNALDDGGFGHRELVVRVNGLDTEWAMDEIEAFAQAPISAICLPKVNSADDVRRASRALKSYGASSHLEIWAMIETPLGVLNAAEIATSDARLSLLLMGTSDLAKEMRVPHTCDRIGLQYALSRCVTAARANGLDIIDGVHLDLEDVRGFRQVCQQGRQMGFDGKSLIHPKQIDIANEEFGLSEEQIDLSRRILEAWKSAEVAGKAVAVVDGKLIEVLHVEEARRTLALAEAVAERNR